jgi:predicted dehydrogenase
MKNILIFGAGSIGNHFANASISLNHNVYITDISPNVLTRMKKVVYPKRYGKWSDKIKLIEYKKLFNDLKSLSFDLIIIGTPPKTHYKLLIKIIEKLSFKKLMVEKPFSVYKEKNNYKLLNKISKDRFIFVGYNHSVGDSFIHFNNLLKEIKLNTINHISVNWKEGWTGILNAHFWLKDEFSSYLGRMNSGGGCLHEHSHGIHFLVCLEKIFKFELNDQYSSFVNIKKKNRKLFYDNFVNINWKLKKFSVNYSTDLISEPADKSLIIYTKVKKYELIINDKKKYDTIKILNHKTSNLSVKRFKKKRATDFMNEIKHMINIDNKKSYEKSFIKLENGLRVQKIINNILKNEKSI